MDKKEFLEELKKNISVLEDDEIKDIVSEYEQHIDMKTAKGLSEEEATEDFGDLKELCAQILEAYHVKSDYSAKMRNERGAGTDEPGSGKETRFSSDWEKFSKAVKNIKPGKAKHAFNRLSEGFFSILKNVGAFIAAQFGAFGKFIRERKEKRAMHLSGKRADKAGEKKVRVGILNAAAGICLKIIEKLISVCAFIIRWIWNLAWIGAALFTGLFFLISLFFAGVLIVLLFGGYPLAGATVVSFGSALCFGSLSLVCTVFMISKDKDNKENGKENSRDKNKISINRKGNREAREASNYESEVVYVKSENPLEGDGENTREPYGFSGKEGAAL